MKTVSGEVVSTKPISLSKAANILSKFASSDNGATPAFAAYLKRASASFDELAQLHKKHKTSGGKHKVKKQRSESFRSIVSEGTVHSVIGGERKERREVDKGEGEAGRINVSLNVVEEKRHKSEKRSEDGGRHNAVGSALQTEGRIGEEIVEGNLAGADIGKKSKKKGRKNEIEAVTTEDQHLGDHDAINANELKNTESFDGSKEKKKKKREKHERENDDEIKSFDVGREMRTKKKNDKHEKVISVDANDVNNEIESLEVSKELRTKKRNDNHGKEKNVKAVDVKNEIESFDVSKERRSKNKNDKHEKGESDDVVDIKKEMQSRPSSEDGNREATQVVENDGDVQKKHKKHKKKNEIKEERVDEQRDESKGDHGGETDHVDKGHKKKHKKRSHDGEERENEGKLDPEGANNKESRKRKHESVGDGEFDGSQERHKSKKKKR